MRVEQVERAVWDSSATEHDLRLSVRTVRNRHSMTAAAGPPTAHLSPSPANRTAF